MKLSIIIAVYNEESTLLSLLNQVHDQEVEGIAKKEIIIVESNSSDSSRAICEKFLAEHSSSSVEIKLILQKNPLGKGNAVREGIQSASGEIILFQDADLEYSTSDYSLLVQPILEKKASFVLGSRHLAAGNWKIRKFEKSPLKAKILNFGGVFFHSFFNFVYGQTLTDPTTMYKVFLRSAVEPLEFFSNRFDFDYEITAKLIRSGHLPIEVPVSYTSRGFEEGKKIRVFRDPWMWIWAILRYRFSRLYRER